jgi:hypothetical protein
MGFTSKQLDRLRNQILQFRDIKVRFERSGRKGVRGGGGGFESPAGYGRIRE